MPAAVYDWDVEQGASASITLQYKDTSGNPVPLIGYSGRGQVREKMSSPELLAEINVTVENPETGLVRIELPAKALVGKRIKGSSHSERMPAVYDIELFHPDGMVIRVLNGAMRISPEVTRV